MRTRQAATEQSVTRRIIAATRTCLLMMVAYSWLIGQGAEENNHDQNTLPDKTVSLSVLTWNVLADQLAPRQRLAAIETIIAAHQPDIICLQEVAPWLSKPLLSSITFQQYHISYHNERPVIARGLAILVRKEAVQLGAYKVGLLPSQQQRAWLVQEILVPADTYNTQGSAPSQAGVPVIPVAIATCHLESPLLSSQQRLDQLAVYEQQLATYRHVIVAGDMNFGDNDAAETTAISSYTDIWPHLYPDQPGYTWDINQSTLAAQNSFPNEPSRRLDRILVRGPIIPQSAQILGQQPLSPGIYASDHFALLATVELSIGQDDD